MRYSMAVALAILLLVACGRTEDRTINRSADALEADVLNQLHLGNQIEMRLAGLAGSRSGSGDVKSFADRIVKDHRDADRKVTALAGKMKIKLRAVDLGPLPATPANLTEAEKSALAMFRTTSVKLAALKGADFDKAFLVAMADDHGGCLGELKIASAKLAPDSQVVKLIDELTPVIQAHLTRAKSLMGGEAAPEKQQTAKPEPPKPKPHGRIEAPEPGSMPRF